MAPATTTKKPTTARGPAATKATAPVEPEPTEPQPPPELDPDGGQGDVLVIPTGKNAPKPAEPDSPVIDVFTYGTKTYSMPVEVTAQQSLHGIWVMKTHGTLAGGMQVIERLLGAQALEVLLTAPEIADEHIYKVIEKVTSHLYGRAEEAAGE